MNASDQPRGVRILIVDDDDNVRRLVSAYLKREGISAARELPMLMLTARGDEDDVLRGFEAGAGSRRLWGRWPAVSRVRRRRGLPDRPES